MKILYYNPTCGSGIEQAGYIFLILLKKLGHTIDLWNTQCTNLQENYISKTLDDYDLIILNGASRTFLERMIPQRRDNVFLIQHEAANLPSFCKILSLNYLYQERFYFLHKMTNTRIPLTYPYAYEKPKFQTKRKYHFVFVGRWNKDKFDERVKKFMTEKKLYIDRAYISSYDPKEYPFKEIVKSYKLNAPINEVMRLLSNTEYLLLPSATECISFVCGEALVSGCLPIVYETKYQEHQQFFNTINCYSMEEFNETILALKNKKVPNQQKKDIFEFSQKNWSISKTLEELKLIFGREKGKGKINVLHNDYDDMKGNLSFKNACIITGESFPKNFFLKKYL